MFEQMFESAPPLLTSATKSPTTLLAHSTFVELQLAERLAIRSLFIS